MKSTIGSVTTYFVGNTYEKTGGVETKYYYAGGSRVAMRAGGTLSFLLSDHLGSTGVVTDASGTIVSELRYDPWGEVRYSSGTTLTNYTFTGQYSNTSDFGLMYYNARWMDPDLGRFASADSIVPGGLQGLDRYAYASNSPVRYTDPSGHYICEEADNCQNPASILADYGIGTAGLDEGEKWKAVAAARVTGEFLYLKYGDLYGFLSPEEAFRMTHGNVIIKFDSSRSDCETDEGTIACGPGAVATNTLLHEFFHVFDAYYQEVVTTDEGCPNPDGQGCYASNWLPSDYSDHLHFPEYTTLAYKCATIKCISHPPILDPYNSLEAFANMGQNWVLGGLDADEATGGFAANPYGAELQGWMDSWMITFVGRMAGQ